MPCSPAKARLLLKEKKAVVRHRTPFTIQLTQATGETVQPVTLGVDAGSKFIGLSASTEKAEHYASEAELRTEVVDLLSSRREMRRARRNRKTRYRAPRFDNRIHSKNKGWLTPSVENKINTHLSCVDNVRKCLPVTKIVVETAAFDIQKIKNPDIEGTDYQQGDQLGFWNVREYVLCRDGHQCCHCHGKSKDPILNVHHLESRKTGGNAPNNLITLCETCHKAYHDGKITLKQKRGQVFRDAAFMGIMRWTFFNRLKAQCPEIEVRNTYGYLTKNPIIRTPSASPAISKQSGWVCTSSRSRLANTIGRSTRCPSLKAASGNSSKLPTRSKAFDCSTRCGTMAGKRLSSADAAPVTLISDC